MKRFFIICLFILFTCFTNVFGQTITDSAYTSLWANKDSSIFKLINKGTFMGTATGHLRVKDKKDTLLLDFKSTKATLHIITDTTEMYDNSTKRYTTKTSNGTNAVTYETYALANILTLQLSGSVYHIGIIDGAADMPVAGLAFNYYSEKNTESLTLYATTSLELSNAREIMRLKKIKYVDAKKLAKTVQLLPGSTLIFTVTK